MKKKTLIIMLLLLITSQLFNRSFIKAEKDNEIREIVKPFIESINKHDVIAFRNMVHPLGLIVIRNFVTGGFGARGKNIRDHYKPTEVSEFEFKVKGESSVSLDWLFGKSLKTKFEQIPVKRIKNNGFGFKDNGQNISPSTSMVIETCSKIQIFNKKTNMEPRIFVLNDKEIALTESEEVIDLSIGGWSIFELYNGKYYLRAIMDFR